MASLIPKTNSASGSATAPGASALVSGELAENKFTGRLYVKTESNAVVDPARVVLTGDVTGTTSVATSENQAGTIVTTLQVVPVARGGTGSQNSTAARTALGVAASGANSDITSVALSAASTISVAPSTGNDLVNKTYADSIGSGINFHDAADYATTAALSAAYTYFSGTSGVGSTITANAVGTLTIDGYTFVSGDVGKRILIKNETGAFSGNTVPSAAFNGIYTLTTAGTASAAYVLTRATDYDTSGTGINEINQGDFILILSGTANANTAWVQQARVPIVVGVTLLTFSQFAAAGGVTTFSGGSTGLTPNTAQNGAIVLAGTLDVNNGGTGAATFTSGALLKGAGIAPITTATSGTDYVAGADASSYRVTTLADTNLAPTVVTATQLTFAAVVQPALDGHTIALNDILLLTAQTADAQNGPWVVTRVGTISLGMILQRPVWFSTTTARSGIFVSVSNGVGYQGTVWMVYSYISYNAGILLGTDSLVAMIVASKNGLPFTSGGTGQKNRQDALNALAGGLDAIPFNDNKPLVSNGTDVVFGSIQLEAAGVSGILGIFKGGTGGSFGCIQTMLNISGFIETPATATLDLTSNVSQIVWIAGTGATTVYMPDMVNTENGIQFRIINKGTGTATMKLFGTTTTLCTISAGSTRLFIGNGGANVAASWAFLPAQTTSV